MGDTKPSDYVHELQWGGRNSVRSCEGTGSMFLPVTDLRCDPKGADVLYLCFPICQLGQMMWLSETWVSSGLGN